MSIGKGRTVDNFKRPVAYVLDPKENERIAWYETANLNSTTALAIAHEMRITASANDNVSRPGYHLTISFAHEDIVDEALMKTVSKRVLEDLGLSEHQYLLVGHDDTEHDHVHIVVNRVSFEGRVWSNSMDYARVEKSLRGIEREFGLREVPGVHFQLDGQIKSLHSLRTSRETQATMKHGMEVFSDKVRKLHLETLLASSSWEELHSLLGESNLRYEQKGFGAVITDGEWQVKASRIHREASFGALQKRLGQYELPLAEQAPEVLTPEQIIAKLHRHNATFTRPELESLIKIHGQKDVPLEEQALSILSSNAVLEAPFADASGHNRFASSRYVSKERALSAHVQALMQGRGVNSNLPDVWLKNHIEKNDLLMDGEQQAAFWHVMRSTHSLSIIEGLAGAGKSDSLKVVAHALRREGYTITATAIQAGTALDLGRKIDAAPITVHSLLSKWRQGIDLPGKKDMIILDEAGMVDVPQFSEFLGVVDKAGAKIVLAGDDKQIQAVGAGDGFRVVLDLVDDTAKLKKIYRQKDQWQRDITEQLGSGDVAAIKGYHDRKAIRVMNDRDLAIEELAYSYMKGREAAPEKSAILLAHSNRDVHALNQAVRTELIANNTLSSEQHSFLTKNGRLDFVVGDKILFLENEYNTLDVRNGTVGTIESLKDGFLAVRLQNEDRLVTVDSAKYKEFTYGYAMTVHKSQGMTVDKTYALLTSGMNPNLAYVAMSRHRETVEAVAVGERFKNIDDAIKALSTGPRKDLFSDYETEVLERVVSQQAEPVRAAAEELSVEGTLDILEAHFVQEAEIIEYEKDMRSAEMPLEMAQTGYDNNIGQTHRMCEEVIKQLNTVYKNVDSEALREVEPSDLREYIDDNKKQWASAGGFFSGNKQDVADARAEVNYQLKQLDAKLGMQVKIEASLYEEKERSAKEKAALIAPDVAAIIPPTETKRHMKRLAKEALSPQSAEIQARIAHIQNVAGENVDIKKIQHNLKM